LSVGAGAADSLVVGQIDIGYRQVVGKVLDAAALHSQAIGNFQPSNGHVGPAASEIKNPAGVIAADGQLVGARAEDAQALVDEQLAARQCDGLAVETGVEDDPVPAVSGGDVGPQRPGAAI